MMAQVYVVEFHPFYQVIVDGAVRETMTMRAGHPPLTWSQQWDIAAGYKEYLEADNGQ